MESLSGCGQASAASDALYGCPGLRCRIATRRSVLSAERRPRSSSSHGACPSRGSQREPRARRPLLSYHRRTVASISCPSANHCSNTRPPVPLGGAKKIRTTHYRLELVESRPKVGTVGQSPTILNPYLSPSLPDRLSKIRLGVASDCRVCGPSQHGHHASLHPSFGPRPRRAIHPRDESDPCLANADDSPCFRPGASFF